MGVLVPAARSAVRWILLYAFLFSRVLSKQTSYVPQHHRVEEHPDVSKMAVGLSGKHFAGVRKVCVGTSQRPNLRFSPPAASRTGCFGRAAPQIARFKVQNDYHPCKALTPRCSQDPAVCRSAVEMWR